MVLLDGPTPSGVYRERKVRLGTLPRSVTKRCSGIDGAFVLCHPPGFSGHYLLILWRVESQFDDGFSGEDYDGILSPPPPPSHRYSLEEGTVQSSQ